MDICWQLPSVSVSAKQQMEAQGLDWTDADHRDRFTAQMVEKFFERISGIVRRHDPKLPLFFNSEAMDHPNLAGRPNHHVNADEGAVRVLLEGQFAFDVVDKESDFSLYKLLILPDVIAVDAALKAKIDAFVDSGGRVLLTGSSGIDPQEGFAFDVGAKWHGTSEMAGGDYLLPVAELRAEGIDDPVFMYKPSEHLTVTDGTSLGKIYEPYFDRRPQHFSGHVNAPSKPKPSAYAVGVEKHGYTYFAYPIFTCYFTAGSVAMREVAEKLVARALGETRLVTTSLPRAGRVTVRRQAGANRDVMHLLHATPALRGNLRGSNIQPIQDLITLADIEVSLAVDAPVAAVKLVPEGTVLEARKEGDRIAFTVPAVRGHQMVEVHTSDERPTRRRVQDACCAGCGSVAVRATQTIDTSVTTTATQSDVL